ncbi:MAG: amidophosphoribosyltransferase [Muribaculaceae bacterium]|nr:amidophosphoribosyltransferase [Muribaculaceae bacterium]
MEQLKHECGVAMIRLLKPLEYYKEKYGSVAFGLDKLYLLMEKQHNRGQEAAGVGVVKFNAPPGHEYMFRERALGTGAISEIFEKIGAQIGSDIQAMSLDEIDEFTPFIGQIYMGHLRYSTTGRSGLSYVHPFLRRNNWRSRNLFLCGNFNMTNVDRIFESIVSRGQHPRIYSDTFMLLEQLGHALDTENHRHYRELRDTLQEPRLSEAIDEQLDLSQVLKESSPLWDGGYVICGATGSGDMFTMRDPHGIRPAFYYYDNEVIVVASERPVIQTAFNVRRVQVNELQPGYALIVNKSGKFSVEKILEPGENARCSFERIYFSRGSDADIYKERKALGRSLVPRLVGMLDGDLKNVVFSFIPNTAEVAFLGMTEGLEKVLDKSKLDAIEVLMSAGKLNHDALYAIMKQKLRIEKVALKDIKLRTFIAEGNCRNDLAAHVYDVTYGCIENDRDTLVVIDDSIVRGTTLKQSIIGMLDRLHPKRIIVVSSSPQVRYPDYYGIDMSRMSEFAAFRAAVALLQERNMSEVLEKVYIEAKRQLTLPEEERINAVKEIYAPFTEEEISAKMAQMLTPAGTHAKVDLLFQTIDGLHEAVPQHPGDWYFSGNYPTPGAYTLVNRAYINFYEGRTLDR